MLTRYKPVHPSTYIHAVYHTTFLKDIISYTYSTVTLSSSFSILSFRKRAVKRAKEKAVRWRLSRTVPTRTAPMAPASTPTRSTT